MRSKFLALGLAWLILSPAESLLAVEPNESFATSTLLLPGVLSLSDNLTPGQFNNPDTFLGIRDAGNLIILTDDNSSLFGDGKASGVTDAPTNGTSIAFSVSGTGDTGFNGSHTETGEFDVKIDVFDSLGAQVATLQSASTLLQPGSTREFSVTGDSSWIGGTYNANIDNAISPPFGGDLDFFTFTGLTVGANYSLDVLEITSGLDTLVYQYNSSGVIDDTNVFSKIDGIVPANGQLTFAVTGDNDFDETVQGPIGKHAESGDYQLLLDIDSGIAADFNNSGLVDEIDLSIWQGSYGSNAGGDADDDFDSDGNDFIIWQQQLGSTIPALATASVPEPSSVGLLFIGLFLRNVRRR